MLTTNEIQCEIARAIENSKPFYAAEVKQFTERLLRKDSARRMDRTIVPELVALAETVKQYDDSSHDSTDSYLKLERFEKYGSAFFKTLVAEIQEFDRHGSSFREARQYAESRGISLN